MRLGFIAFSAALVFAPNLYADNKTLEAAVGAGVGAAIGNEVGGREGAIVGGAVGAVIGTSGHDGKKVSSPQPSTTIHYEVQDKSDGHPSGRHCPPGQAKKGRC